MTTSPRTPHASVQHLTSPSGVPDLPLEKGRRSEDYEFQIVSIPPRESIGSVRAGLTEKAEYGRWELARTRISLGGGKRVWLRRRIITVASTLGASEVA